jgi:CRP/FNR family transcriptional regulator
MANRFRCPRYDCRGDRCPAKEIFSCLSPSQEALLSKDRLARRYEKGSVVVHNDTPALGVLSVHSGQLKLTRLTRRGQEVVVGLRGPGDLLGVREVLSAAPYQVTVETLEPSVVCAIPRDSFLAVVRDSPELAMRLLGRLAHDCMLAEEQLVTRAELNVRARIARLLVALTDERRGAQRLSGCRQLSMAREEMAVLVGTTRETLSRTLGQFSRRGCVQLANGKVSILDPDTLQRLAE